MIYITGDCHGDFRRLNNRNFPEQQEMTREDIVIIAGDCGLIWAKDERARGRGGWRQEQYITDWLQKKSFTVAFVDGNHENFDRLLFQFPVKTWNGGLVHEIKPNIVHLMRGEVYTIEGETYFTFGGATSHDIASGIIDSEKDPAWKKKIKHFEKHGIYDFRTKGYDWWPQESLAWMPEEDVKKEKDEAKKNLERFNWKVDFCISHELPAGLLSMINGGQEVTDEHSLFLEEIRQKLSYRHWFAGHYHINKEITSRDIVLYEQIIRIH